jgi:LmbE family N-acetylglucosaminyl deacetylase
MAHDQLHILVVGAHPDDCEYRAGGVATLYRRGGHEVRFVSMTNGESGHQRLKGAELASLRKREAQAVADLLDIQYDVLDHRDGYLQPTLEIRDELIALIRDYRPDLILTHRPNDYHPDHRYTSQLVCDAAYMVTVPAVVPESPALRDNPVIAYLADEFERPYPFTPTVAVDIEPVFDSFIDQLDCHKSQFYDWLAWNHRYEDVLPDDDAGRRNWLAAKMEAQIAPLADKYRETLVEIYGEVRGRQIRYIEAFEPCEYGAPLTRKNRRRLFPFLPR